MCSNKKEIILKRITENMKEDENKEFLERIKKIFELFGEDEGIKILQIEHQESAKLELEYTKLRWTIYTALTTVSFGMSGYILSTLNTLDEPVRIAGLFLAWFIQFFATLFYWWMHEISHNIREYLQQIEIVLGFYLYTLRSKRPLKIGKTEIKFHWFVYMVTILYLAGIIVFAIKINVF